jgi:hypothetical protein
VSLKWKPRGRLAVRPTGRHGLAREGVVVGAQLSDTTLLQNWTVGAAGTMRTGPCAGGEGYTAVPAAIRLHYGMMP